MSDRHEKDPEVYLYILLILLTILLAGNFIFQELNKPSLENQRNKTEKLSRVTYVEMPDGEKLIAEVHCENSNTELILKFQDGRKLGSEKGSGSNLTDEEIRKRAVELVHFLKRESRNQAMSTIIFWGMDNGIPNNESTKAANAFGKCIDEGKNPDECVQELKAEYEWLTKINFSDFILLYKNW